MPIVMSVAALLVVLVLFLNHKPKGNRVESQE